MRTIASRHRFPAPDLLELPYMELYRVCVYACVRVSDVTLCFGVYATQHKVLPFLTQL